MKYLKTYENTSQVVKLINWDLINDARDMALEYFDEKYSLIIDISIPIPSSHGGDRTFLYTFIFDHSGDRNHGRLDSFIEENMVISYSITIISFFSIPPDDKLIRMQEELISRLSEAYPNESIIR